jgi:hypothetical protein
LFTGTSWDWRDWWSICGRGLRSGHKALRVDLRATGIDDCLVLRVYGGVLRGESAVDGAVEGASEGFAGALWMTISKKTEVLWHVLLTYVNAMRSRLQVR